MENSHSKPSNLMQKSSRACLKITEHGCVVLDQPQRVATFIGFGFVAACCGWSSTQPRSAFRQALLLILSLIGVAGNVIASQWQSIVSESPLGVTIHTASAPASNASPVVIYLQNLAAPRVGLESDETILQDFRAAGYLVVEMDFANHTNARVPFINRDLGKLRDDIRAKKFLGEYKLDDAHIFIVPEGCRLKRDVMFYDDGGRKLAMDVIYPSKPKKPVGALIEFSCDNQNRFGNTSLSICSDTILDAFATDGFAVAMADHPVANASRIVSLQIESDVLPKRFWLSHENSISAPMGVFGFEG